jgi:hypothetical protein
MVVQIVDRVKYIPWSRAGFDKPAAKRASRDEKLEAVDTSALAGKTVGNLPILTARVHASARGLCDRAVGSPTEARGWAAMRKQPFTALPIPGCLMATESLSHRGPPD